MKCPCKGCTERRLTCHGFCERYQDWKKEDAAMKAWLRSQNPAVNDSALKGFRDKIRNKARGWNGKRGSAKDYG